MPAIFQDYQRLGDAAINVLNDFTLVERTLSIDEAFADVAECSHLFGSPLKSRKPYVVGCAQSLAVPISIGVARTSAFAKITSQVANSHGLVVVDPRPSWISFTTCLSSWDLGSGPGYPGAAGPKIGVHTIGQLAKMPEFSLERLLGRAAERS